MRRELGAEALGRLEDVDAGDWSLTKISVEDGVNTGLKEMRSVGTVVVREGVTVFLLRDATERRTEISFLDAMKGSFVASFENV